MQELLSSIRGSKKDHTKIGLLKAIFLLSVQMMLMAGGWYRLSCYLAIQLGWQHSGVFWGVFFSETSLGLFTLWLFSRGKG